MIVEQSNWDTLSSGALTEWRKIFKKRHPDHHRTLWHNTYKKNRGLSMDEIADLITFLEISFLELHGNKITLGEAERRKKANELKNRSGKYRLNPAAA